MKRQGGTSPVLIELLLVVLFFALCMSIDVQVLARANALSVESARQSGAVVAASDLCERIKADPAGFGAFDAAGLCTYAEQAADYSLSATVKRSATGRGVYYSINVKAAGADGAVAAALHAGCYAGEVRP